MSDKKTYRNEEKAIWTALRMLRSEPILPKDYVVILFFLALIKAQIINPSASIVQGRLDLWLEEIIRKSGKGNESLFLSVLGEFDSVLRLLTKPGAQNVLDKLFPAVQSFSSELYAEVFDELLYKVLHAQGRYGDEVVQPLEITRLISSLAELPEDGEVFNPFAGLASFGVFLNDDQRYSGQEITKRTWAIGMLRLHAHEREHHSEFTAADSVKQWPTGGQHFDLVVSNPPFRLRLKSPIDKYPDVKTVEHFVLKAGLDLLKAKGKVIVLVPMSFLVGGGVDGRIRKDLLEQDVVETVVSLPGRLMKNTGIALAVIVLSRDKQKPGSVRLVDGQDFTFKNAQGEQILEDQKLIAEIQREQSDTPHVKFVQHQEIEAAAYSLDVKRYFLTPFEGVPLKEFIHPIKRAKERIESDELFVRISDLKENPMDFTISASELEVTSNPPDRGMQLNQSCLLLATRGRKLKPTFFRFSGTSVFIDNRIIAFAVDESKVDIAFLVNELNEEYVGNQIGAYQTSLAIPTIKLQDILEIKVKLPGLEEQRAKVSAVQNLTKRIEELTEERDALISGNERNARVEFGSLKHTLGRPRQNILSWSENLLTFIKANQVEFETLNQKFADEFFGRRIDEVFNEIKTDVNFITAVLEKGDHGLILEKYKKEFTPLSDLNDLIRNQCNLSRTHFDVNFMRVKGEGLSEQGIRTNRELLNVLFDNILSNADKYAFSEKKEGNEVVVELTATEEKLVIELKNNGRAFPKNFQQEKFRTKYATSDKKLGTGLGGYDIDRIAAYLGSPGWQLILNEDPVYPVIFKFEFSIEYANDD